MRWERKGEVGIKIVKGEGWKWEGTINFITMKEKKVERRGGEVERWIRKGYGEKVSRGGVKDRNGGVEEK